MQDSLENKICAYGLFLVVLFSENIESLSFKYVHFVRKICPKNTHKKFRFAPYFCLFPSHIFWRQQGKFQMGKMEKKKC